MSTSLSFTACKLSKQKWKVLYCIAYLLSYSIPQQQNNIWDYVIPLPGNKKTVLLPLECFHKGYVPLQTASCDTGQLKECHKVLNPVTTKTVTAFSFTFSSQGDAKTQKWMLTVPAETSHSDAVTHQAAILSNARNSDQDGPSMTHLLLDKYRNKHQQLQKC